MRNGAMAWKSTWRRMMRPGQVDVAALAGLIGKRTKLIALTHAPTDSGLVNPVAAVGRLAQAAGVPFLLDACQSVGQMPIDVAAIGCTMLTATGRKFLRAPRGTGFLYVRQDWQDRLDPPTLDLRAAVWTGPDSYTIRGDARRFETWESAAALRLGLGAAVDHALGWGLEPIRVRIDDLARSLRAGLVERGAVVADRGPVLSGIVTFTTAESPQAMAARLQAQGISTSPSRPRAGHGSKAYRPVCVRRCTTTIQKMKCSASSRPYSAQNAVVCRNKTEAADMNYGGTLTLAWPFVMVTRRRVRWIMTVKLRCIDPSRRAGSPAARAGRELGQGQTL